jgi:hypothetical protein
MQAGSLVSQPSPDPGYHAPEVAKASIETLRRLREALDRHAGQAERELLRTLDGLIDAAYWNGQGL